MIISDGQAVYTRAGSARLISERRGNNSQWYHSDGLTSSRTLTNSSQTTTDTFRYDVWGDIAERTGTTPTPHQFVGALGYEREADSGLYFIGTRYYDPSVGRFLSQDLAQWGVNWYGYAANNPVRYYDWQGLGPDEPWPWYLKPVEWLIVKPAGWIHDRVASLIDKITPNVNLGSALISKDPLMKELAPEIVAAGKEADRTLDQFKNHVGADIAIALATRNVHGGVATAEQVLDRAIKWLGRGYREIAPGVFRSADNLRQFRMTSADLGAPQPHVHFEAIGPNGRTIIENSHVYIK